MVVGPPMIPLHPAPADAMPGPSHQANDTDAVQFTTSSGSPPLRPSLQFASDLVALCTAVAVQCSSVHWWRVSGSAPVSMQLTSSAPVVFLFKLQLTSFTTSWNRVKVRAPLTCSPTIAPVQSTNEVVKKLKSGRCGAPFQLAHHAVPSSVACSAAQPSMPSTALTCSSLMHLFARGGRQVHCTRVAGDILIFFSISSLLYVLISSYLWFPCGILQYGLQGHAVL